MCVYVRVCDTYMYMCCVVYMCYVLYIRACVYVCAFVLLLTAGPLCGSKFESIYVLCVYMYSGAYIPSSLIYV